MPLKVTDFGISLMPVCDFLLVNTGNTNSNNHISHRFQVIAAYWSNFRFRQGSGGLF